MFSLPRAATVAMLVTMGFGSSARAATPAVLVGPDLSPRVISLQGISEGSLSFFDTDRRYRSEALEDFVQLRDVGQARAESADAAPRPAPAVAVTPGSGATTAPATAPAGDGAVELIDGQRLTGRFVDADKDGQKFTWSHALIGSVALNLDHVRSITLRARPAAPAPATPAAPGNAGAPGGPGAARQAEQPDPAHAVNNPAGANRPGAGLPPAAGPVPNRALGLELNAAVARMQPPQPVVPPPLPATARPAAPEAPKPDPEVDGVVVGATAPSNDRVELINGDALEGFVTAISARGLELKTAEGAQSVSLPLERVWRVTLTNPMREGRATRHRVWLRDGSRLLVTSLAVAGQELRLQAALAPGAAASTPVSDLRRIDFAGKAGAAVPLASLAPAVSGGEAFGVPAPPRVLGESLRVHAPVTLGFELPPGASRLAGQILLDATPEPGQEAAQAEAQVRQWADFDVIFRLDDKPIARAHLDGQHPRAEINIPLDGRRLTIELTQGANGPVMDRALLRDFQMLVSPRP